MNNNIRFLRFFDTILKYREFIKIDKHEILLYNKIILVEIRKTK